MSDERIGARPTRSQPTRSPSAAYRRACIISAPVFLVRRIFTQSDRPADRHRLIVSEKNEKAAASGANDAISGKDPRTANHSIEPEAPKDSPRVTVMSSIFAPGRNGTKGGEMMNGVSRKPAAKKRTKRCQVGVELCSESRPARSGPVSRTVHPSPYINGKRTADSIMRLLSSFSPPDTFVDYSLSRFAGFGTGRNGDTIRMLIRCYLSDKEVQHLTSRFFHTSPCLLPRGMSLIANSPRGK